jgi:hypothetical protein
MHGVKFWLMMKGCLRMDKQQLIDRICEINKGAKVEFLARFSEKDLSAYLEHLMELSSAQLSVAS